MIPLAKSRNTFPLAFPLVSLISLFLLLSSQLSAQYGVYIMDPDYYVKHGVTGVKIFTVTEEEETLFLDYAYNSSTKMMTFLNYGSGEKDPETVYLKYDDKRTFQYYDLETKKGYDEPMQLLFVDHLMIETLARHKHLITKDKKGRITRDSIVAMDEELDHPVGFFTYEFTWEGNDLAEVYFWEWDLLGFPNDLQKTTFTWSADHLTVEAYIRQLDHEDLVAHLYGFNPYSLTFHLNEVGLLTAYETSTNGNTRKFRFEYR